MRTGASQAGGIQVGGSLPAPSQQSNSCCLTRLIQKIFDGFLFLVRKIFCMSKKDSPKPPLLPSSPSTTIETGDKDKNPQLSKISSVVNSTSTFVPEVPKQEEVKNAPPSVPQVEKYAILINGKEWEISSEEDRDLVIEEQLKPLVYAARESVEFTIKHSAGAGAAYTCIRKIRPLLEEDFEIHVIGIALWISPKVIERSQDGKILKFKDGTELTIVKGDSSTVEGYRLFPDKTREEGTFRKFDELEGGWYMLREGTRTKGQETIYLFATWPEPEVAEDGTEWFCKEIEGEKVDFRVVHKTTLTFECVKEKRKHPFAAYQIEMSGKKWSLTTPEEQEDWIKELDKQVNAAHQQVEIHVLNRFSDRRWRDPFLSLLREHVDIFDVNEWTSWLTLKPKIAEPIKREGNKTFTRFVSGVVEEFEEVSPQKHYVKGERRGSSIIEKGKFCKNGMHPLLRGTITENNETRYVLPERLFTDALPWTLAHIPNEEGIKEWRVLEINGKGSRYGSIVCKPFNTPPLTFVKEHLAECRNGALKKLYQKEVLSPEDMKQVIPQLFKPGINNASPPIFSHYRSDISFVLKLAKTLGIPVDLCITHQENGEEQPFFTFWIKERLKSRLRDEESEEKVALLFILDPDLIVKEGESIFNQLLAHKSSLVLTLDFSSCVLSSKNRHLFNVLSKSPIEEMLKSFGEHTFEEQRDIVKFANQYQRFDFLERVHESFKECSWEPVMEEIKRIAGDPVIGDPGLISPLMTVKERKDAMYRLLKALRERELLLTQEESDKKADGFRLSEWDSEGIGDVLGRNYLQEIIDKLGLTRIKVPQKRAVLGEEDSSIPLDVHSNGHIEANLSVWVENIQVDISRSHARIEEIEELVRLLEAVGFDDIKDSRSQLNNHIVIAADGLYLMETGMENFQKKPVYQLFDSLAKRFLDAPYHQEPILIKFAAT